MVPHRRFRRGDRHSEHRVRIKDIFGDSGKAKSSADALLYTNGIEVEFPSQVLDEARAAEHKGIPSDELYRRLDLRAPRRRRPPLRQEARPRSVPLGEAEALP